MSIPQLTQEHLDIINNQEDNISRYTQRKEKNDGTVKYRPIIAPEEEYKELQKDLVNKLIDNHIFQIHKTSYGWMPGLDRFMCASKHVDKKVVVELDISDFFGHIREQHLKKLFIDNNFYDYDDIIKFITVPKKKDKNIRYIAQGFPTSSYFANVIRYPYDVQIYEVCQYLGLTVTNYGDNIFISGEHISSSLIKEIRNIFNNDGLPILSRKVNYMPWYRSQQVLGITVNKKITIPKDYTGKIISDVISCLKNNIVPDESLMGRVAVLKLSDNKRNYNYVQRLINKIKEN